MREIIPIGNFIMAEIPAKETKIEIPDTVNQMTLGEDTFLIAVGVGPDVKSVKIGDGVITLKQTISSIMLMGKQKHLIKEDFVMAVVRETEE